ncbi:glycogen debranching N-terminal domain-containing protein [Georgenia sp. AZ-5]|uniref:amylo-alpha-1,6-glucosidase n=1 Tax=Georgenia sp. AZ-5 TaxID=3367526 RepID=UPI003754D8CD
MTQAWTQAGEPAHVVGPTVTVLSGSSFCLSDQGGDVLPGSAQGLYVRDTRVLSSWQLRIDDEPVEPLTVLGEGSYRCTFVGRSRPRAGLADSTLLVERHRFVGAGMREDLVLRNLGREPAACVLSVHVAADFGDLFEVKQGRVRPRGRHSIGHGDGEIRLSRSWQDHTRELRVSAPDAATTGPDILTFRAVVPARGTWRATIHLAPVADGEEPPTTFPADEPVERAGPAVRRSAWLGDTPRLHAHDALRRTLARSSEDLESLRIDDPAHPGEVAVAAGAPWFMALFGRDSLLTALMTVGMNPALAFGTAQALARHQGEKVDPVSEEEPGRIPHELRFGVDATASLGGNVYYGTADATPLFVMLVAELLRWGYDRERVHGLMPHVDRALEWVERYGDADGDGFVEYERATDRGLVNQGWKDSFDGISFADGRIPEGPVALCEVQAYVYGAYRARALLAAVFEGDGAARAWEERAARFRRAFNERFWLSGRGWYALALDGHKTPVDALTSNMGHALWTGAADADKARAVAALLLSPEMFSGWGVRTLATSMGAYNPMSYHNGSVWPHDNAVIAAGLRRYGHDAEAARVAGAVLQAARAFDGRLPELFCGFDRLAYARPIPYPTACSPQAWASATPVELLRVLLGARPCVPHGRLRLDPLPALPGELRLTGVPLADARVDLELRDGRPRLRGLPAGLEPGPEPCPCDVVPR